MLRAPFPGKSLQEKGCVPRKRSKGTPRASQSHSRHLFQEASWLIPPPCLPRGTRAMLSQGQDQERRSGIRKAQMWEIPGDEAVPTE